jgi:hypothetical protein
VADNAIDQAIEDGMSEPRKAAGDGVQVEQHSLPDQIAAAKYLSAKAAAKDKQGGVRFAKLVPGGTVSRDSR